MAASNHTWSTLEQKYRYKLGEAYNMARPPTYRHACHAEAQELKTLLNS